MPTSVREFNKKYNKSRAGTWCCGCFGFANAVLAICIVAEWHKFTPVYQDIVCKTSKPGLKKINAVSLDTPFRAELVATVQCSNPNPYGIELQLAPGSELSRAFYGDEIREVGTVTLNPTEIAPGTVAEPGLGAMVIDIVVTPGFRDMMRVSVALMTGYLDVYFELHAVVVVKPVVLGSSAFRTEVTVDQNCALEVQIFPLKSGDVVCSKKGMDTLDVPPLKDKEDDGEGIKPEIDEEVLEKAEAKRDTACGCIVAFLATVAIGACCLAAVLVRRGLAEGGEVSYGNAQNVGFAHNRTERATPVQLGQKQEKPPFE